MSNNEMGRKNDPSKKSDGNYVERIRICILLFHLQEQNCFYKPPATAWS